MRLLLLAMAFSLGLLSTPAVAQKGGEEETGPYDVVANWPQPFARQGYIQGSQGGVFAESPNRIFLGNRGELKAPDPLPANWNGAWGSTGQPANQAKPDLRNNIVIVDANEKMIESWTQHDHLFQGGRGPHRIKISPHDPERHVWVVDDMRHQIFKFTNDGKRLVMTLGVAGVEGNDDKHFGRPTDIAWLPDGAFFISDGYINTRVMKFDKDGKFLMQWGTPGAGPGQFNLPHAVDVDRNRRVYVSDRSNSRIQVFDENGKHLDTWPNIRSAFMFMVTADQHLWVADGQTNKLLKYDLEGKLLYSWGTWGTFPGAIWGVHQFSVDSDGNLYVAETYGGRTQKFRPKPGADRSRLIGAPPPLMSRAAR
ncbi:MAG: peptidyl-alpha-hydroxyglycine alpha-amidating lyase family protein [Terriglobia bacterium]